MSASNPDWNDIAKAMEKSTRDPRVGKRRALLFHLLHKHGSYAGVAKELGRTVAYVRGQMRWVGWSFYRAVASLER